LSLLSLKVLSELNLASELIQLDLHETENICIIDLNSLGGEPGETHINLSGTNPGSLPELKILGFP
jgi:hypothetical protein